MNGVTGRMGTQQHLLRSICALREQGGISCSHGDTIWPEPILVGRNREKLERLARQTGIQDWSTDLDAVLSDDRYTVYFDAQITGRRPEAVRAAIKAGKHIYCEKPLAMDTQTALELFQAAEAAGVKHGVVQDKLWLPGMIKLKLLIDSGFFGQILSVRGEFGYWVFEGDLIPAQRPSWNYRQEEGGGIILDMLSHWQYLLQNLFGEPRALSCLGATHIPTRFDEQGKPYACTAEDACYVTFELATGVIAHFNSSWCVRVRRDDLLTLQVDGTRGSAVAGLRKCWAQHYTATPKPVWNPDVDQPIDFFAHWSEVPDTQPYENAFKAQWERFLKHVVCGEPFPWNFLQGAKGVQLAEMAMESWKRRAWVEIPQLDGS
ncbi:MAG: gfo/Idh/MocA family oxidoreductase [Nitrospinota bacterium]|nr:MAG: gfo/Idh/MocA family oxidoreductase [Nitrospinota bacterium]